jgi:hypothetical protein
MNEMLFAMPTDVIGLPERERAMLGKLLKRELEKVFECQIFGKSRQFMFGHLLGV